MSELEPEFVSGDYSKRMELVWTSEAGAVNSDITDYRESEELNSQIAARSMPGEDLAIVRFSQVTAVTVRHPEALLPGRDPDKDLSQGGRLQSQELDTTFPLENETRYILGVDYNGPVSVTKIAAERLQAVTPYLQKTLARLALADAWSPDLNLFLRLLPDHPADLDTLKTNLWQKYDAKLRAHGLTIPK